MKDWEKQAEFIATVIDICGPGLWTVELGAGRRLVASVTGPVGDLAPGDVVRIKFRIGNKTPRIVGYSEVDRQGLPTRHAR